MRYDSGERGGGGKETGGNFRMRLSYTELAVLWSSENVLDTYSLGTQEVVVWLL